MRTVAIGIVALVLGGCPKKQQTSGDESSRLSLLEELDVSDRSRPDDRVAGVTGAVVRGWVLARLRSAKHVRVVKKPGPKVYRLHLEFGVGERDGDAVALVSARASVEEVEGVPLQASAVKRLPRASAAELRRVVDTVTDDIVFQAGLAVGTDRELVRVLTGEKDAQRLAAAVEITAVRRPRAAVPALIKLLKHDDEQVADRSIGALVAIGDQRAVRPLTRLSKFSDTEKMAKILDGIGSLGGKEARDYLELVATGHEDPDIRNMAAEALERLKRRAEPKGVSK